MEMLRWIGFGAFFVSSLVIGLRLIWLARRTGHLPELLIGVSVLGIGPLGYGVTMLAHLIIPQSAILSACMLGGGLLAMHVGGVSHYVFVWNVFRRSSRWAGSVSFVAIALFAAAFVGDVTERGLINRPPPGGWYWVGGGLRLAALAWGSCEALRYFGLMRRRDRLGLGDPVVTNRLLLWGVGSGAAFLGSTIGLSTRLITGLGSIDHPMVSLLLSLHGIVAAVAMWLAFIPPPAYLARVKRRSHVDPDAIPSI